MSVKKVKISELPQLPQESDASGIFMPAADENNHTYRVPLSRYDDAKNEAATAAVAANAAAEEASAAAAAAQTAADAANNVVNNGVADSSIPASAGLVFPMSDSEWDEYKASRTNITYDGGYGFTQRLKIVGEQDAPKDCKAVLKEVALRGSSFVELSGYFTNTWYGATSISIRAAGTVIRVTDASRMLVRILDINMGEEWACIEGEWVAVGPFASNMSVSAVLKRDGIVSKYTHIPNVNVNKVCTDHKTFIMYDYGVAKIVVEPLATMTNLRTIVHASIEDVSGAIGEMRYYTLIGQYINGPLAPSGVADYRGFLMVCAGNGLFISHTDGSLYYTKGYFGDMKWCRVSSDTDVHLLKRYMTQGKIDDTRVDGGLLKLNMGFRTTSEAKTNILGITPTYLYTKYGLSNEIITIDLDAPPAAGGTSRHEIRLYGDFMFVAGDRIVNFIEEASYDCNDIDLFSGTVWFSDSYTYGMGINISGGSEPIGCLLIITIDNYSQKHISIAFKALFDNIGYYAANLSEGGVADDATPKRLSLYDRIMQARATRQSSPDKPVTQTVAAIPDSVSSASQTL